MVVIFINNVKLIFIIVGIPFFLSKGIEYAIAFVILSNIFCELASIIIFILSRAVSCKEQTIVVIWPIALTLSFFQHSNYVRLSRFFTNYMHEGHSSTSAALSIPRRLKCSVISQFEWKRYLKLGSAVTFIDSDGH